MKYLVLIHLNETELGAMPAQQGSDLNKAHWDLNEELKAKGHFITAEALAPSATTKTLRVRNGKLSVVDGPFTEAKEMVAGFYFIEAKDIDEAVQIAARIPSSAIGTLEVRPARQLDVIGLKPRWGADPPEASD
jgi:hypothetical protein